MEPEIVPDFLVPLVKNVHPAQLAALKMRKQRFNDFPSDRPYMRETREAISAVSALMTSDLGDYKEVHGMRTWVKLHGGSAASCRGDIVLDVHPAYVLAASLPFGARKVWDPNMDSGSLLQSIDPVTNIGHMITKSKLTFSSRDMAVVSRIEFEDDGRILQAAKSVVHPAAPETSGRVRAELQASGMSLEAVLHGDAFKCKGTYVATLDLKGWTPTAIIQYAASQSPLCLVGIRDFIHKYGPLPFSTRIAGVLCDNAFDNDASEYMLAWRHADPMATATTTEIFVPTRRYQQGVTVTVSPATAYEASAWSYAGHGVDGYVIRLEGGAALQRGTKVVLVIAPQVGRGGAGKVVVNGAAVNVAPLTVNKEDLEAAAASGAVSASVSAAVSASGSVAATSVDTTAPATVPAPAAAAANPAAAKASTRPSLARGRANCQVTTVKHRHTATEERLWKRARALAAEDVSLWKALDEYKGTKLYQKDVEGHPMGMLMGRRTLQDITPYEVFATLMSSACRSLWEHELFDYAALKETLSVRTNIVYALFKGRFPASPRDTLLLESWDEDADGSLWLVACTIEDPVGPPTKAVRSNNELICWHLRPAGTPDAPRVEATYITLTTLNGWIPDAVIRLVAQQVPQAVRYSETFARENGAPPHIQQLAGTYTARPDFKPSTSHFSLSFTSRPTEEFPFTVIALPLRRYGKGATITLAPADATVTYDKTKRAIYVAVHAKAGMQVNFTVAPSAAQRPVGQLVVVNNKPVAEWQEEVQGQVETNVAKSASGGHVAATGLADSSSYGLVEAPADVAAQLAALKLRADALEAQLSTLLAASASNQAVVKKKESFMETKWGRLIAFIGVLLAVFYARRA